MDVLTYLDRLKIDYTIIEHLPVYSLNQANMIDQIDQQMIIKNLFLCDDKRNNYYLVLLKNDKNLNLKRLQKSLQSRRLTFASEQELKTYLGVYSGAVSPLGIINDQQKLVTVVIDNDLKLIDKVAVHPNINTKSLILAFDDLLKLIKTNGNQYCFIELKDN